MRVRVGESFKQSPVYGATGTIRAIGKHPDRVASDGNYIWVELDDPSFLDGALGGYTSDSLDLVGVTLRVRYE